jgi:hypothetical protein
MTTDATENQDATRRDGSRLSEGLGAPAQTAARPYLEPRLRYVLAAAEAGLAAARGAADRAKARGDTHECDAQAGIALAYADMKMRIAEATTMHLSDCALHNAPAYKPGPCDCGGWAPNTMYTAPPAEAAPEQPNT